MTLNLCVLYLVSLKESKLSHESSILGGLQEQMQIFSGEQKHPTYVLCDPTD